MAGGRGDNAGDDTPPAWVVDLYGLFVDNFLEITKLESPVSKVDPSIRGPGEGDKRALQDGNSGNQNKQKATVTNTSELLRKMSTDIINMLKEEMKNKQNTDKQVPMNTTAGASHKSELQGWKSAGKQSEQKDQKTPAWVTKMSKFKKAKFIKQFKGMFDEMK